jgi:cytochrome oxidase Cu insertion factor (SCO1/SenC/PrrC family)
MRMIRSPRYAFPAIRPLAPWASAAANPSRRGTFGVGVLVVVSLAIAYVFVLMSVGVATARQPAAAVAERPVELVLEDQFDRRADLAALRGQVVIVVYGDQKATDVCRKVGESLHVCWHPEAKGQPPLKALTAPVLPLDNLKPGQASPNVVVVPAASCGKVPGPIRGLIRAQVAKASPEMVVWLDFEDKLKTQFGECAGEANLVVFDADGRLRGRLNGTPDQAKMDRLVKVVQGLRYEAVK